MKIVQADALDSIDCYEMREAERPAPGLGEVLIKVAVCGVGYVDALMALGGYQVKPKLPYVPGGEISGTIAAVGEGVSGFAEGDRVLATARSGGFAEYALAPSSMISRIPVGMNFAQAAGFRVNYMTAYHGLKDRAALAPGERMLVIGAAGGVGAAAVQLGKLMGAEVIAMASSPEKQDFTRKLGADHVIDTVAEGWRDRLKAICGGKGPNVIFDPVCGPLFEPAFRSLAWGGRHLVVGFIGGPIPALPVNLTLMKGAALVGVDVRQFMEFEGEKEAAHLVDLLAWVDAGRLTPPVQTPFAFNDFRALLNHALSGKGLGKAVLEVG